MPAYYYFSRRQIFKSMYASRTLYALCHGYFVDLEHSDRLGSITPQPKKMAIHTIALSCASAAIDVPELIADIFISFFL